MSIGYWDVNITVVQLKYPQGRFDPSEMIICSNYLILFENNFEKIAEQLKERKEVSL